MQRSSACFVPLRGTKACAQECTSLDEIKAGWITRVFILAPTGIKEATPVANEPHYTRRRETGRELKSTPGVTVIERLKVSEAA